VVLEDQTRPHLSELWFNISKLTTIRSDLQGRNSTWKHMSETGMFLGSAALHIPRGPGTSVQIFPGTLYIRIRYDKNNYNLHCDQTIPCPQNVSPIYKSSQLRLSYENKSLLPQKLALLWNKFCNSHPNSPSSFFFRCNFYAPPPSREKQFNILCSATCHPH